MGLRRTAPFTRARVTTGPSRALQAGVDIVLATAVVLVVAASGGAVVITVDVASLQDRRSSPSVVGRAPLIDARRRPQWRQ